MGFSTATAFRRYETALKQLRETMVLQSERNQ